MKRDHRNPSQLVFINQPVESRTMRGQNRDAVHRIVQQLRQDLLLVSHDGSFRGQIPYLDAECGQVESRLPNALPKQIEIVLGLQWRNDRNRGVLQSGPSILLSNHPAVSLT